jgi:CheY-like chemotaxis protein
MVYSTVKAHHGQIEIQSRPGQGTCVRMRFPAHEGLQETPEPVSVPDPGISATALRVLLVDDDDLVRSSLQTILEALGHAVSTAASGEEALAKVDAGLEADVVIMDMNMPGLGGSGTLPRLRALRPTVPVLIVTGRYDQPVMDLLEAHPQVSLLSKPFTMKDLQQHLRPLGRG